MKKLLEEKLNLILQNADKFKCTEIDSGGYIYLSYKGLQVCLSHKDERQWDRFYVQKNWEYLYESSYFNRLESEYNKAILPQAFEKKFYSTFWKLTEEKQKEREEKENAEKEKTIRNINFDSLPKKLLRLLIGE